jgi:hypothetical protein
MKRKIQMIYNVCTMAGEYQVQNQRFWRRNFLRLEKAIGAAREQHAEMADDERYTLVVADNDNVFFLIHQGEEYTQASKPTALEKADELVTLADEN